MSFYQKLNQIVKKHNSLACVGLDSDFEKIPQSFKNKKNPIFEFNKSIIKATADFVCAYKLNIAFYEAIGVDGIVQLKMTFDFLNSYYPHIPTILDGKRGDIGSSNEGYVKFIFDYLKADGATVNPYLGEEALKPFLKRKDKGIFVLCRTSNPGATEFQDLKIALENNLSKVKCLLLYLFIAQKVAKKWNKNKNCGLVVGATYPDELKEVRKIVGEDIWLLVPGVGAQGADIEKTVKAGLNSKNLGMIINSSRGIIFAKNPKEEVKKLKELINKYRK